MVKLVLSASFSKLALTSGYEKSAFLPYPTQAHHKPQTSMEKHTLSVYSKSCLVYCSLFPCRGGDSCGNSSKYVIAFFAECSTKVRVFCFPAKKSTNYFTLNRNNNKKENNSVEIKYERMKEWRMKNENRGECECFTWEVQVLRVGNGDATRGVWQLDTFNWQIRHF